MIETADGEAVRVCFITDASGIFDEMAFPSARAAVEALRRNGFRRHAEDAELQSFLGAPSPPFRTARHPNGRIYSSGPLLADMSEADRALVSSWQLRIDGTLA